MTIVASKDRFPNMKMEQRSNWVTNLELARKMYHVLGLPITLYFYASGVTAIKVALGLFIVGGVMTLVDDLRMRIPWVNQCFIRIFGMILRKEEHHGPSSTSSYMFGCGLVLLLFPREVGVLSILALSIADPLASAFGRTFFDRLPVRLVGRKSLAGFSGAWLGMWVVLVLLTSQSAWIESFSGGLGEVLRNLENGRWWWRVLVALCAGVAESMNEVTGGDDNLVLPLSFATLFTLVTY